MIELDFSQIRIHNGSQNAGFEELVCQLAHLSPPKEARYFVRKDGAGGDAGVECYWVTSGEHEHAWQVKYFLGPLNSGQWAQITESVQTALRKHPKLTKYYICLPRDWNDSRKEGRTGKPIISAWDKWVENVSKWEEIAQSLEMEVEFCYWCKHELSMMLQKEDAEFSGRARYWFGNTVLTIDKLYQLANKSRISLGDRFTPEHHIPLPISQIFEGLGSSLKWWDFVGTKVEDWQQSCSRIVKALLFVIKSVDGKYKSIKGEIDALENGLYSGIEDKTFTNNISVYLEQLLALKSQFELVDEALQSSEDSETKDTISDFRADVLRFQSKCGELYYFLKSDTCKAAAKRSVLLVGEAGIGKSHLLCDVSLSRLSRNLPTVFMLGQHYSGGNPLSLIKDALDLNELGNEELLGALDGAGESKQTNTLVIIDAINEGSGREDWINYLTRLIAELSKFRHISIALSCRTTYVNWLVPPDLTDNGLVKVTHNGFKGFEHRAASKYLSQQGIAKPSAPITSPEFTNPLFLKTCCKAMLRQGVASFPRGLHGISSLLEFYLDSVEITISKIKHYRLGERVAHKVLNAFAGALYPDFQFGLPLDNARSLVNSFDTKPQINESLFDLLISEGMFVLVKSHRTLF